MADNDHETGVHRENFGARNVRFLAHNLLKSVRFNDEPVAPAIIAEKDDDAKHLNRKDKYFLVEELPDRDLRDIMLDNEIDIVDKLKVISHVVGQFQAIDNAGIILFDRAGRNIIVLDSNNKISTRQIDLEEFFDKTGGGFYSSGSFNGPSVDYYEEMGFNLWGETVSHLSDLISDSLRDTDSKKAKSFHRKYSFLAWVNILNILYRERKRKSIGYQIKMSFLS